MRRNGMFKDTNPHHVVVLDLACQPGHETILQKIHQRSLNKWLVHVPDEVQYCSELSGFKLSSSHRTH